MWLISVRYNYRQLALFHLLVSVHIFSFHKKQNRGINETKPVILQNKLQSELYTHLVMSYITQVKEKNLRSVLSNDGNVTFHNDAWNKQKCSFSLRFSECFSPFQVWLLLFGLHYFFASFSSVLFDGPTSCWSW